MLTETGRVEAPELGPAHHPQCATEIRSREVAASQALDGRLPVHGATSTLVLGIRHAC